MPLRYCCSGSVKLRNTNRGALLRRSRNTQQHSFVFKELFVTRLCCAITAKRIEILFGIKTPENQKHIELDGAHSPLRRGGGVVENFANCKV